jgi:uncharacterized protein YlxW (UPF0749 family)
MPSGELIFIGLLWGLACYLFATAQTSMDVERAVRAVERDLTNKVDAERRAREQLAQQVKALSSSRMPEHVGAQLAELGVDPKKIAILK